MSNDEGDGNSPNSLAPRATPSSPNPFGAAAPSPANPFGLAAPAAPSPFGGTAPASPNPFQTAPPAAPNPFDAVMGGPPAQAAPAPAEGPITLLPPMKTAPAKSAALDMLGLELDERAPAPEPEPGKKAPRPELQHWGQDFPGTNSDERAKPDRREATRPPSPGIKALAPPKKRAAWPSLVVGVAVLGIGGAIAKKVIEAKEAEQRREATKAAMVSGADQLLALGIRPENAPDCWVRDKGFDFEYKGAAGDVVSVTSIEDVPTLYRSGAKCVKK
jgi:hypothetical protein